MHYIEFGIIIALKEIRTDVVPKRMDVSLTRKV